MDMATWLTQLVHFIEVMQEHYKELQVVVPEQTIILFSMLLVLTQSTAPLTLYRKKPFSTLTTSR